MIHCERVDYFPACCNSNCRRICRRRPHESGDRNAQRVILFRRCYWASSALVPPSCPPLRHSSIRPPGDRRPRTHKPSVRHPFTPGCLVYVYGPRCASARRRRPGVDIDNSAAVRDRPSVRALTDIERAGSGHPGRFTASRAGRDPAVSTRPPGRAGRSIRQRTAAATFPAGSQKNLRPKKSLLGICRKCVLKLF
jgi:hypothetical protein